MKFTTIIPSLLLFFLLPFTFSSCEKSDPEDEDPQQEEDNNTFTDNRDGKQYKWIKIGTQIWMAENLAYLPSVNSFQEESGTEPRYYVYDYNETSLNDAKASDNYNKYGVLYNWPAASAACPAGWHLPSDEEWKALEMYLGMSREEADKTGYRGTDEGSRLAGNSSLWDSGNLKNNAAFGTSGFVALPGGFYYSGSTSGLGRYGKWWSNGISSTRAVDRSLYYTGALVGRGDASLKEYGYSVRCIKD